MCGQLAIEQKLGILRATSAPIKQFQLTSHSSEPTGDLQKAIPNMLDNYAKNRSKDPVTQDDPHNLPYKSSIPHVLFQTSRRLHRHSTKNTHHTSQCPKSNRLNTNIPSRIRTSSWGHRLFRTTSNRNIIAVVISSRKYCRRGADCRSLSRSTANSCGTRGLRCPYKFALFLQSCRDRDSQSTTAIRTGEIVRGWTGCENKNLDSACQLSHSNNTERKLGSLQHHLAHM
jgi:hypothetical protein